MMLFVSNNIKIVVIEYMCWLDKVALQQQANFQKLRHHDSNLHRHFACVACSLQELTVPAMLPALSFCGIIYVWLVATGRGHLMSCGCQCLHVADMAATPRC